MKQLTVHLITKSFIAFLFLVFVSGSMLNAQTTKKKVAQKTNTAAGKPNAEKHKPPLSEEQSVVREQPTTEVNTNAKPEPPANTTEPTTQSKIKLLDNFKLADKFVAAPYLGFTSSFAHGAFVDHHKSFYDVSAPDTKISGKIKPVYFFSVGANFYYAPFYNREGILSNIAINLGAGYVKRGFTSENSLEYTPASQDLTDKTVYNEKYRLHYLTRQLTIRYGKKFFAEIGLIHDNLLGAARNLKLEHEVSGSDAYDGGFKTTDSQSNKLDESLLNKKSNGYVVCLGWQFSEMAYARLSFNNTGKVFKQGDNFRNHTLQFQLIFPLYSHSFFK